MRSSLVQALLVARMGTACGRRALDLRWAALTRWERAQFEREADALTGLGIRAELIDGRAPLFHSGPYESIGLRVLGVCGQHDASGTGVRLAQWAARAAVAAGATVITGDADGPEAAAVRTALGAGGLAVRVLAEGLPHAVPQGGRLVTVSPCAPGQPWSVDAAMARNAVIAELCTELVVIGAGSTGTALDAGMRALAAGRPVLAVGATGGSRLLVDYGATAAVDELELAWWLSTRLPSLHTPTARVSATSRARVCGETARPSAGSRPDGRPGSQRPARTWSAV